MLTERTTIAALAVEAVVQAFSDREELRFALKDEPTTADINTGDVGQQDGEHLGDTATAGRGVNADDTSTEELASGVLTREDEIVHSFLANNRDKDFG